MEIMVIAVIALIVLGPSRLPEAARSLGKGMREMRDSFSGKGDDDVAGRLSAKDAYDEDEDEDDLDVAASGDDDETVVHDDDETGVRERDEEAEQSSTSAGRTA